MHSADFWVKSTILYEKLLVILSHKIGGFFIILGSESRKFASDGLTRDDLSLTFRPHVPVAQLDRALAF